MTRQINHASFSCRHLILSWGMYTPDFWIYVANIGTARNLFDALKTSLTSNGLDFSRAVAFMSDITNVMKGTRSGVQKVIKNEHSTLYDVGCICHLADLTESSHEDSPYRHRPAFHRCLLLLLPQQLAHTAVRGFVVFSFHHRA